MIKAFEMTQYGNFRCSCGCGQVLGRATNGTDGLEIEQTICIGDDKDIEGLEWRCFKPGCFGTAWGKYCINGNGQKSIEKIYKLYPVSEEVV